MSGDKQGGSKPPKKETPEQEIKRLLAGLSPEDRERVIAEHNAKMLKLAKGGLKTMVKDVKRKSGGRFK
ncbi:hypothetical protein [Bosea sp. FBZP-16]|uniref:hypothetical protein n=1 Tax=Bosea sp. FBZP-16 TaxID=2065382 RepID=UPI00131A4344|nr:hypothetical protein [Bosea sp. FBZP-16]